MQIALLKLLKDASFNPINPKPYRTGRADDVRSRAWALGGSRVTRKTEFEALLLSSGPKGTRLPRKRTDTLNTYRHGVSGQGGAFGSGLWSPQKHIARTQTPF